jgi:hypothetical protein
MNTLKRINTSVSMTGERKNKKKTKKCHEPRSWDLHATLNGSEKCQRRFVRNRPKRQTFIFEPHESYTAWRTRSYFSCHIHIFNTLLSWPLVCCGFTYTAINTLQYVHIYVYIIVMMYKVRVRYDVTAVRFLNVITTYDEPKDEKNICSLWELYRTKICMHTFQSWLNVNIRRQFFSFNAKKLLLARQKYTNERKRFIILLERSHTHTGYFFFYRSLYYKERDWTTILVRSIK